MRLCPNCGEDCSERARFCETCGAALEKTRVVSEGRRTATILFGDIVGSTALAERTDPETVRRVVTRVLELGRAVVERHDGIVERFAGDALMAVFGLPEARSDDALRAVRAASELLERLGELNLDTDQQWGVAVQLRIGVNTGEVATGNPFADEIFVTGDAVNVAARLEQAAMPMEIVIGQHTNDLVERDVECEPIEPLELKGKSEPVPAYRVLSAWRDDAATKGIPFDESSPDRLRSASLCGRSAEMVALDDLLHQARTTGTCLVATVIGSPGIGKTRLVEEFLGSLPSETAVMQGACLSYEGGSAYLPAARALRGLVCHDDAPADVVRGRIASIVGDAGDAPEIVATILSLMSLSDVAYPPEQTSWAFRRFAEGVSSSRPLVIFIDDIHWAEPLLFDLLSDLAEHSTSAGILILCTARPVLADAKPEWVEATTKLFDLHPLDHAACERVVGELLGGSVASSVQDWIYRLAAGNPLFVRSIVMMLMRDDRIEEREGSWVAAEDLSVLSVPPSIQSVLGSVIGGLEPLERAVLERASIIGDLFYVDALRELAPGELRDRVEAILGLLEREGLVGQTASDLSGETAFRFGHGLLRDVAEQRLRRSDRAYLHERFADWLESHHAEAAETAGMAGYHLEQAYLNLAQLGPVDERGSEIGRRGASLLQEVARSAVDRGDRRGASRDFQRAASLLGTDTIGRARLLLYASRYGYPFPSTEPLLREALRILSLHEDAGLSALADMMHFLMLSMTTTGGYGQLLPAAERAAELLTDTEEPRDLCYALRNAAFGYEVLGWIGKSIDLGERACSLALDNALPDEWAFASQYAVGHYVGSGRKVPDCVARARECVAASPDRTSGARVSALLAQHLARAGAFEEARSVWDDAAAIVEGLAGYPQDGEFLGQRVCIELYAGQWSAAAEYAKRFADAYYNFWALDTAIDMSLALARDGRLDEAVEALDHAVCDPDDIYMWSMERAVRAFIVAAKGETDIDLGKVEAAEARLRCLDMPEVLADVIALKSEALALVGSHAEALSGLTEAIGIYDELGVRPSAERVRSLASAIQSH